MFRYWTLFICLFVGSCTYLALWIWGNWACKSKNAELKADLDYGFREQADFVKRCSLLHFVIYLLLLTGNLNAARDTSILNGTKTLCTGAVQRKLTKPCVPNLQIKSPHGSMPFGSCHGVAWWLRSSYACTS